MGEKSSKIKALWGRKRLKQESFSPFAGLDYGFQTRGLRRTYMGNPVNDFYIVQQIVDNQHRREHTCRDCGGSVVISRMLTVSCATFLTTCRRVSSCKITGNCSFHLSPFPQSS